MIRNSVRHEDETAADFADRIEAILEEAAWEGYRIMTGAGFEIGPDVDVALAEDEDEDESEDDHINPFDEDQAEDWTRETIEEACEHKGGCPLVNEIGQCGGACLIG